MLVAVHDHPLGHGRRHPPLGGTGARIGGGVDREHAEIDRRLFERATLVEPRQQQEVVDERAHAQRLRLGAAHRLLQRLALFETASSVQLRVAADRRDRRAQLVGRVGDELPQSRLRGGSLVECFLDAGQHRVERVAELSRLRALVATRNPMGEIAAGDGRRRRRHLLDRTHAEADDPPGDEAEDAEHEPGDDHLDPDQPAHRRVDIGQRERGDERDAAAIAADAEDAVPGVRRRIGSDRERLRASAGARRPLGSTSTAGTGAVAGGEAGVAIDCHARRRRRRRSRTCCPAAAAGRLLAVRRARSPRPARIGARRRAARRPARRGTTRCSA